MRGLESLKVAIVCDWLTGIGGAERVVLELHKMFPDAPIYTSQYSPDKIAWFKDADVRTTWLQKLPAGLKKFLPVLRAMSFSGLDLSEYDLVLSSSGAEAKAVKTGPKTIHINYCHSPTHYYWIRYDEYMKHPGFGVFNPLARLGLKLLVGPMKKWDYKAAQRPSYLIANSEFTRANIKKYYGREASVIHPPVDIERFKVSKPTSRQGFVITGRQTPYKRIDLAIMACSKLGLELKVIGNGPEHQHLTKLAGPTVSFITDAANADIPGYLQSAKAFILPGLEDFGIVGVEALAAGTPVIAYGEGGSADFVQDNKNGVLFSEQTEQSLDSAMKRFEELRLNSDTVAGSAEPFSTSNFQENILKFIDQKL